MGPGTTNYAGELARPSHGAEVQRPPTTTRHRDRFRGPRAATVSHPAAAPRRDSARVNARASLMIDVGTPRAASSGRVIGSRPRLPGGWSEESVAPVRACQQPRHAHGGAVDRPPPVDRLEPPRRGWRSPPAACNSTAASARSRPPPRWRRHRSLPRTAASMPVPPRSRPSQRRTIAGQAVILTALPIRHPWASPTWSAQVLDDHRRRRRSATVDADVDALDQGTSSVRTPPAALTLTRGETKARIKSKVAERGAARAKSSTALTYAAPAASTARHPATFSSSVQIDVLEDHLDDGARRRPPPTAAMSRATSSIRAGASRNPMGSTMSSSTAPCSIACSASNTLVT